MQEEVNPIVFYSLLYRIAELIVRLQIKEIHSSENDPYYALEMLETFFQEFFKIYLLFRISTEKKSFRDFKLLIYTFCILIVRIICGNEEDIIYLFFSTFLRGLIICCSVVYIHRFRGRLAGFLDLMNASLETLLFWTVNKYLKTNYDLPHAIFSITSSSFIIFWYLLLDYGVVGKVLSHIKDISTMKKNPSTMIFFLFMALFKFLEYPELPRIYPSSFMVDDVMNDVFITTFIFCVLFMKGKKREKNLQSLSNTVTFFFVVIMSFSTFYMRGQDNPDNFIFKIMLSNSQVNTFRTMVEMLYIRHLKIWKGNGMFIFLLFKSVPAFCFIYFKTYHPNYLILVNPIINWMMILIYLLSSNEKILKLLPIPDKKISIIFSLLFTIPLFG